MACLTRDLSMHRLCQCYRPIWNITSRVCDTVSLMYYHKLKHLFQMSAHILHYYTHSLLSQITELSHQMLTLPPKPMAQPAIRFL